MNRPLRIGIDIDDVVNDFFPHWVDLYNKKYNKNIDYSLIEDYDLRKVFVEDEEWEKFCSVISLPEFYSTLKVDEIARIVIKELQEKTDSEIFFITGTYPQNVPAKYRWIKDNFPDFPDKNILFVPAESKKYVSVDVLIEDNPSNLREYWVTVLLINKNYNIKYEFYDMPNIHRVNGWEDIRNIFVEKFDLLPKDSPELKAYLDSFGAPTFNNSYIKDFDWKKGEPLSLSQKLLKCKTENDFSNLLTPYFDKTYNAGYNAALGDIAKYMKNLDKFKE